jgi:hypothetical protein
MKEDKLISPPVTPIITRQRQFNLHSIYLILAYIKRLKLNKIQLFSSGFFKSNHANYYFFNFSRIPIMTRSQQRSQLHFWNSQTFVKSINNRPATHHSHLNVKIEKKSKNLISTNFNLSFFLPIEATVVNKKVTPTPTQSHLMATTNIKLANIRDSIDPMTLLTIQGTRYKRFFCRFARKTNYVLASAVKVIKFIVFFISPLQCQQ